MLSRWLGGLAAAAVALVACVLVILDLTDAGLRRWWDAHALTTDTVAGLLVLMITVLVVDQVVRLRQGNSKARAVAVQVAILMTQANSASQAVSQVLAGSGDRDIAREEFRAYTMMLLAVAPTLIDANTSRNFLEQAQHLDGEMALALNWFATAPGQIPGRPARRRGTSAQVRIDSTAPDLDPGDAVGRSRRSSRPTGQARDPGRLFANTFAKLTRRGDSRLARTTEKKVALAACLEAYPCLKQRRTSRYA